MQVSQVQLNAVMCGYSAAPCCFINFGKTQIKPHGTIVMEVAETPPKFAAPCNEIDAIEAVTNSSQYDYILHNNKKSIVIFNGEPQ